MEYHLAFKDKDGKTRAVTINSVHSPPLAEDVKYDLSFERIEDLRELLNMGLDEEVTVGAHFVSYKQFKTEILQKIHRIYISKGERIFEQVDADFPGLSLEKLLDSRITGQPISPR